MTKLSRQARKTSPSWLIPAFHASQTVTYIFNDFISSRLMLLFMFGVFSCALQVLSHLSCLPMCAKICSVSISALGLLVANATKSQGVDPVPRPPDSQYRVAAYYSVLLSLTLTCLCHCSKNNARADRPSVSKVGQVIISILKILNSNEFSVNAKNKHRWQLKEIRRSPRTPLRELRFYSQRGIYQDENELINE